MASSSSPARVDLLLQRRQFLVGPELVRVAGQSPAGIVADRLVARLIAPRRAEVVHQVDHHVRAAALPGELIMLRIELMTIQAQSEFHGRLRLPNVSQWSRASTKDDV